MTVLFYIAAVPFCICVLFFITSIYAIIGASKRKRYTQKGEATLLRVVEPRGKDEDLWFEIAYTVDGVAYKAGVNRENTEGISAKTPAGTQLPIWYDPDHPERVIITEDPTMRKTVESWKRTRKRSFIGMLIFLGIMVPTFPKDEEETDLPRNVTTIGQFSPEISALAEKTPTALVFTESIGSPGTFSLVVDDPAVAREALHIILSAQVSKVGCQVDMAQYRHEEYCFVFGNETFSFDFLPHSYFCYNGQDYELGESRLTALCDSLHEMAAETAAAQWYGDDAMLQTRFVDNGDEARSVTELTLTAEGETLTGVIEGAYDVLSIEKLPDGYAIRYTYGDFYSHDTIRSSYITVENGEMIITDIAQ